MSSNHLFYCFLIDLYVSATSDLDAASVWMNVHKMYIIFTHIWKACIPLSVTWVRAFDEFDIE